MERITIEPGKMGGKPCIRGLRFTVYDLMGYLASGMTQYEIIQKFPYLEPEGFTAVSTTLPSYARISPYCPSVLS